MDGTYATPIYIKELTNLFSYHVPLMMLSFTILAVTYSVGGPALVGKQYQQLHAVDSFHSRKLENFKWFYIATVFLIFN